MVQVLSILILSCVSAAGSNSWQQHVAYGIRVTLNDSLHTLEGHEKIVYTNHSPDTLTFLWFHLWPNAYRHDSTAFAHQLLRHHSTRFHFAPEEDRGFIDSLDFTIEGESVSWDHHPEWIDVAKITLRKPLFPGQAVTLETPFFVKLPRVLSRLGHSGRHYEISQWYPKPAVYDVDGWHPMPYLDQGEFYSEFGTFDVYITLPREYRIMATGTLVNGEEEYAWLDSLAAEGDSLYALDKKSFKKKLGELQESASRNRKNVTFPAYDHFNLKTLHFHQDNVHDFAWFADPDWIVRKGELWLVDSTRMVTLWSMYLPRNAELWERSIEYLHDAGYWYSQFFGDYPYDHITAVDGDMASGGAMEYPNITVISSGRSKDLLEYVIMHEVGHNWFYGVLGSNERDHPFLDEGLNDYANIRYWEKKYPHRNGAVTISDFIQGKLGVGRNLDVRWAMSYVGYQHRAQTGDDQPIELPADDFHQSNYGSVVYGKTGIFTRFLHHYLGEETMNRVMRDYYDTWKFRHPSPDDFKSAFERNVEEDLGWFFDGVLRGTGVIDYAVVSLKRGAATLANRGTLVCPVELASYGPGDEVLERRWLKGFTQETTVTVPENTRKVVIDPDNRMPDIRRANNSSSKSLRINFVFDQPTYQHHEINLVPWARWNRYNGVTPGVIAYMGYIPGFHGGVSITPQWDFRHGRLVGSISLKRSVYRTLGFRAVTLYASLADHSGRQGLKLEAKGLFKKPVVATPFLLVTGSFFFHDIRPTAVDTTFYTPGRHAISGITATYRHRPNPFLDYWAGGGAVAAMSERGFARLHLEGKLRWRYARGHSVQLNGWVGSFILAEDIPHQYRTWMSGGVDADFEDPWVFDRTADRGGPFNIYTEQFVPAGPSLRVRTDEFSTATSWALNLDHSLPGGPISLFADAGGATDLDRLFLDGGLKVSVAFVNLYFPVYQSWDPHELVTGFRWLGRRARFEFDLDLGILSGG